MKKTNAELSYKVNEDKIKISSIADLTLDDFKKKLSPNNPYSNENLKKQLKNDGYEEEEVW